MVVPVLLLMFLGQGDESAPLSVIARVERGTFYVGQPIRVRVSVTAEGERPDVVAPRLAGGQLVAAGKSFRAVSTSAIGDAVSETNQYGSFFLLVPNRPGTITVPPFLARLDDRQGRSRPLSVEVRMLPPGAPSHFLGGVGSLEVQTEVQPQSVRVGEVIEYVVRLQGPGAIGSTGSLSGLDRVRQLSIAPTVQVRSSELVVVPATPTQPTEQPEAFGVRTLKFAIRPTRAGSVALPPVQVAWLDPASGRYQTVLGPAVPVRVVDSPRLDRGRFEYRGPVAPSRATERRLAEAVLAGLLALGLVAGGMAAYGAMRRYRLRYDRLADRYARSLAALADRDPEAVARAVAEAMSGYFQVVRQHPPGALTPDEAARAVEEWTGDADLASRAALLVRACDRARFAGVADQLSSQELIDLARAMFARLATRRPLGPLEGGPSAVRDRPD